MSSFTDFIIKNKVIGFFDEPVTLASGRSSSFYVNWRTICEDVALFDELTEHVLRFIVQNNLHPDCFYGVPEGGTKLGLFIQYFYAKGQRDFKTRPYTLAMGRGKPKERGPTKDRLFLGHPSGSIILIEDVATTGDSLLKTIDALKEDSSISIDGVLILTDRMQKRDDNKSVKEAIEERGIKYYSMSNARELLEIIFHQDRNIEEQLMIKILKEFE